MRSLKSGASDGHFMRTLRSDHFLRALRGSKDLQRILRSSQPPMEAIEPEDDEFLRDLRTTGHFLRSLRSLPADEDGPSGHFLRSLRYSIFCAFTIVFLTVLSCDLCRSAHDFMRMVRRSDGHFLRSLRDANTVGDQ